MLLGQYELSFDKRKGGELPVNFQDDFSGGSFVTQGFEQNLILLTEQAFEVILQKLKTLNVADPLARLLLRKIIGNASGVNIDENGRFQLPQDLQEYANIETSVILVGQGDYCEIWAPQYWEAQQSIFQDVQENVERFANLPLHLR